MKKIIIVILLVSLVGCVVPGPVSKSISMSDIEEFSSIGDNERTLILSTAWEKINDGLDVGKTRYTEKILKRIEDAQFPSSHISVKADPYLVFSFGNKKRRFWYKGDAAFLLLSPAGIEGILFVLACTQRGPYWDHIQAVYLIDARGQTKCFEFSTPQQELALADLQTLPFQDTPLPPQLEGRQYNVFLYLKEVNLITPAPMVTYRDLLRFLAVIPGTVDYAEVKKIWKILFGAFLQHPHLGRENDATAIVETVTRPFYRVLVTYLLWVSMGKTSIAGK